MASILPIRNRIQIPVHIGEIPVEPMRFDHLIFRAAVYPKKKIHSWTLAFTLPTLVINLESLPERISEGDFAEFVGELLENERIDDLFSESTYYELYKNYGFESIRHDIRPLLRFKKVKHIFVFQTTESRAARIKPGS